MTQQHNVIYNTDKESEKSIEWVLKRAQDLFKDNKGLIVSEPLLCPVRNLQALTMSMPVLPSYIELTNSLASMCVVFRFHDRAIEEKECERLIQYLVFHRKEDKE